MTSWEPPVHPFGQVHGAPVRVCSCGKWPDHHVHTGNRAGCTCDGCNPQIPEVMVMDLGQMKEEGWTRMSWPSSPRDPHSPVAEAWVAPDPPEAFLPPDVQAGDRIRLHAEGVIPSTHATVYPHHPGDPGLVFMGQVTGENLRVALGPVVFPRPPWWRRVWRAVLWCLPARRVKL